MPKRDIATIEAKRISKKLAEALSDAEVEKAARQCGFLQRRRKIAPAALLIACISTLGAGTAAWLADILRAFNAFTGKAVRYKPFHNQLSKRRFPIFMHAILERALAKLTAPVLESLPKGYTYLHTNLARATFNAHEVGRIDRLRWQIELLFKEWKSYANLHKFDTTKSPIAEGLIWASLLAATIKRAITHAAERACGTELSTQRAACSAKHFLDDILAALLDPGQKLLRDIRAAFVFLARNALRAHPERDRRTGRLAAGLRHVGAQTIS